MNPPAQHSMAQSSSADSSEARDITVLVPTHKRPEMLRSCLQSIATQSHKERINTVIVSENSEDDHSRCVAQEFSDQLPIVYVQHTCGFTAQEHGIWLAHQVTTRYTAQIADDDMWGRYHLEEAMRCFAEHPSLCAFFGQAIVVENNTCHPLGRFSGSFLQISNSADSELVDFRIWDQTETAINCIANTPLNIWAVVARSDAHREAIASSAGDPVYGKHPGNDRLYIWRLSLLGDIGIGRNISLFYRRHPSSDIQQHMNERWQELIASDLLIGQEIARQAGTLGIDACKDWHERYQTLASHGLPPERIDLWNPEIKGWLLDETSTANEAGDASVAAPARSAWVKGAYLFCPPILLDLLRKVKSKLKSRSIS